MATIELRWLPDVSDWAARLRAVEQAPVGTVSWPTLVSLANARLDFLRTDRLDGLLRRHFPEAPATGAQGKPVRLAVLASSTVAHLLAGVRVAALRRGIWLTVYEANYGQYLQELLDTSSGLHQFRPTAVLLAMDARHLTQGLEVTADADQAQAVLDEVVERMRRCWGTARDAFRATVLQQAVLPVLPPLLGNNEGRLPGSAEAMVTRLNARLREAADADGAHIVAVDRAAAMDGIRSWHNPVLWHRAKQEVSALAAPLYGDLVARLIAAQLGRSSKCLVLDLDNTLWGGVIGDDGLEGIELGQNTALGEAFVAVQMYAAQLSQRGVILAVCSKNDESNALAAFEKHPEMVLRRADIASFVANWDDKATNLRRIAQELNIGLDSLVFLDDNPFERNLIRQELPEVLVPEIPDDDPALVPDILADAGYFEGLAVTDEDLARTGLYQANNARAVLQTEAADLPSYLRGLEMQLVWRRFDQLGLSRISQLINKTNQFNLTTRRYTTEDVVAVMNDPRAFGLQLRLVDRFGDNGIIAIVIGRLDHEASCIIDTWLMSCRVLGRQVEEATLNVIAEQARVLGAARLVGIYVPTPKNGMVAKHYKKLGFANDVQNGEGGSFSFLPLQDFVPNETFIEIVTGS